MLYGWTSDELRFRMKAVLILIFWKMLYGLLYLAFSIAAAMGLNPYFLENALRPQIVSNCGKPLTPVLILIFLENALRLHVHNSDNMFS